MRKELKILICVLGGLVAINLVVLDLSLLAQKKKSPISPSEIFPIAVVPTEMLPQVALEPTLVAEPSNSLACPSACKEYIQTEMTNLTFPTAKPVADKTSTPKVVYLPIGCSGTTTESSWTDISGCDFYLDMANYPSVKSVSWEVSLQSYQSTNPAYIRLYDVTGKRAVDASELTTNSSAYEYLRSGKLTIWAGNNLYRVQAKASAANTVNFVSPRLKITLE